MQGCGYGFLPMMGGVSELFARLIVAVIAIKVISYPLACFCDPAAWVTAAVFTGVSYLFVMKDIDKSIIQRYRRLRSADIFHTKRKTARNARF